MWATTPRTVHSQGRREKKYSASFFLSQVSHCSNAPHLTAPGSVLPISLDRSWNPCRFSKTTWSSGQLTPCLSFFYTVVVVATATELWLCDFGASLGCSGQGARQMTEANREREWLYGSGVVHLPHTLLQEFTLAQQNEKANVRGRK